MNSLIWKLQPVVTLSSRNFTVNEFPPVGASPVLILTSGNFNVNGLPPVGILTIYNFFQ